MSDESLSDTIAAESTPEPRPAGTPGLWPFIHLPRRKRAEFMEAIQNLPTGGFEGSEMQRAALAFRYLADIESAMRVAARDTDRYDEWARSASDDDLSALFQWYMRAFQPGEAKPSPA